MSHVMFPLQTEVLREQHAEAVRENHILRSRVELLTHQVQILVPYSGIFICNILFELHVFKPSTGYDKFIPHTHTVHTYTTN